MVHCSSSCFVTQSISSLIIRFPRTWNYNVFISAAYSHKELCSVISSHIFGKCLLNVFPDRGCYFQVNGLLKLGMPINTAFRTAMDTWASWVETVVNTSRTHIFFRTFEPSHWGYSLNTFFFFLFFPVFVNFNFILVHKNSVGKTELDQFNPILLMPANKWFSYITNMCFGCEINSIQLFGTILFSRSHWTDSFSFLTNLFVFLTSMNEIFHWCHFGYFLFPCLLETHCGKMYQLIIITPSSQRFFFFFLRGWIPPEPVVAFEVYVFRSTWIVNLHISQWSMKVILISNRVLNPVSVSLLIFAKL